MPPQADGRRGIRRWAIDRLSPSSDCGEIVKGLLVHDFLSDLGPAGHFYFQLYQIDLLCIQAIHLIMAIELEAIDDVKSLPGGFPAVAECLPFTSDEAQSVASSLVDSVRKILSGDTAELEKLYYQDGFWRDQVSLAWTFRTFHKKE